MPHEQQIARAGVCCVRHLAHKRLTCAALSLRAHTPEHTLARTLALTLANTLAHTRRTRECGAGRSDMRPSWDPDATADNWQ